MANRKWGIYGPEKSRKHYRVRIRAPDGTWRSRSFATKAEAAAYRQEIEDELSRDDAHARAAELFAKAEAALAEAEQVGLGRRTVGEAVVAYELARRDSHKVKHGTLITAVHRLNSLLEPLRNVPVARVSSRAAREAYRVRVDSGKSAATHRNELAEVRRLWKWLDKERWVVRNPWMDVEPVGEVPRGKEQLRTLEAIKVRDLAVARARGEGLGEGRWAVVHQRGALAVLLLLYLALRRSEIVGLEPRDVGRGELWYRPAKQRKGTTKVVRLRVPAVVAELLEPYAASCAEQGMERLFPYSGRWLLDHVKRLCALAGVPEVCAHAMRGTHSSLATEAGATGEMVAKQLNHSSPHVTRAHYIQGSGEDDGRNARVARQLDGSDVGEGERGARSDGVSRPVGEVDPTEGCSVRLEDDPEALAREIARLQLRLERALSTENKTCQEPWPILDTLCVRNTPWKGKPE